MRAKFPGKCHVHPPSSPHAWPTHGGGSAYFEAPPAAEILCAPLLFLILPPTPIRVFSVVGVGLYKSGPVILSARPKCSHRCVSRRKPLVTLWKASRTRPEDQPSKPLWQRNGLNIARFATEIVQEHLLWRAPELRSKIQVSGSTSAGWHTNLGLAVAKGVVCVCVCVWLCKVASFDDS